jgi:hypothetical protein
MQNRGKKSGQYFNTCYSSEHRIWESYKYVYKILPDLEQCHERSSCKVYDAVLLQKTAQKGRKHYETVH